ncbi:MAG: leucine-rich repeat protein [Clostridia bacterium]|nr:leucine-rich repeat protein [Clostridia bacterium]
MMKRLLVMALVICALLAFAVTIRAEITATPLTLSEAATAVINQRGGYAYFSFTPETTGVYKWYSSTNKDTYGYLYNSNLVELARNDDDGEGYNFEITEVLVSGNSYYFGSRFYDADVTGGFQVCLEKVEDYQGQGLIRVVATEQDISVAPNGNATLQVIAETTDGGITYRWYQSDGSEIDSAVSSTYTVENIVSETTYYCQVSDDYGNSDEIRFDITVENHLVVDAEGDTTLYVEPNSTFTLKVSASCDYGQITYQWYRSGSMISDAMSNTYTTETITSDTRYCCEVFDAYGNSDSIDFYIYVENGFSAGPDGSSSKYVGINDTATLKVLASCNHGSLTYQWYHNSSIISGAVSDEYTTEAIAAYTQYYCIVSDEYGHSSNVRFSIYIDNHLSAKAEGDNNISIDPEDTATLTVSASCDTGALTYQWYENSVGNTIDGAAANTYTTEAITSDMKYICRVSDDYGNIQDVWFYINIDNQLNAQAIGDDEIEVTPGDSIILSVSASCHKGGLTYRWYKTVYNESGESFDTEIEGATAATLTTGAISATAIYRCRVEDEYGASRNVYFNVYIDNGLKVVSSSEYTSVGLGETVTLEVQATCNQGLLHYKWYVYNDDETSINGPICTITNVTGNTEVECYVYDDYGNHQTRNFYIQIDNNLRCNEAVTVNGVAVPINDRVIFINPGDSIVISLNASCTYGSVYYDWYSNDENVSFDSGTCTLTNVREYTWVSCDIYDNYDNRDYFRYEIIIDNDFSVEPVGDTFRQAAHGDQVTLSVSASAQTGTDEIIYEWAVNGNEMGEHGSSITFTAETTGSYICYATDVYGKTLTCAFFVNVGVPRVLKLNETVSVTVQHGERQYYVFTPSENGRYTISSSHSGDNDPYVYLYDSHGNMIAENDDSAGDLDFSLTANLTAGIQYRYLVQGFDTQSARFTMILTKEQDSTIQAGAYVLRPGQTARYPWINAVSITSDNTSVVTVSGLAFTAVNEGTAKINIEWENGYRSIYTVQVMNGSVMSMPSGLRNIESEAFTDDDAVRFVTLNAGVANVGAFAFSNSGLEQIVVPSSSTTIAISAFYGIEPTILCHEGSNAAEFAMNKNYQFLYID